MRTKIYELDLVDMYGRKHSVWGYGIDKINDHDDPVDLSPVRSLFPHVPDQAFKILSKKRIDILMGLNFNALFPCGGAGVDAVRNLRALRSIFGTGWVIGGCHQSLESNSIKLTSHAATARIAKVSTDRVWY